jgi:hypothetical protein
MKIQKKLIAAIVIPTLLIGILTLIGLFLTKNLMTEYFHNEVVKLSLVPQIDTVKNDLARNTFLYLLYQNPKERSGFEDNIKIMNALFVEYKKLNLSNKEGELLSQIEQLIHKGIDLKKMLFDIADQGTQSGIKIRELLDTKIEPLLHETWVKQISANDPQASAKKTELLKIEIVINSSIREARGYTTRLFLKKMRLMILQK